MQILEELWKNDLQIEKPFIHNRQYSEALSRYKFRRDRAICTEF